MPGVPVKGALCEIPVLCRLLAQAYNRALGEARPVLCDRLLKDAVDSALARLNLRFCYLLDHSTKVTGHIFSGAKALYLGN
jgi:hypothetical protein